MQTIQISRVQFRTLLHKQSIICLSSDFLHQLQKLLLLPWDGNLNINRTSWRNLFFSFLFLFNFIWKSSNRKVTIKELHFQKRHWNSCLWSGSDQTVCGRNTSHILNYHQSTSSEFKQMVMVALSSKWITIFLQIGAAMIKAWTGAQCAFAVGMFLRLVNA